MTAFPWATQPAPGFFSRKEFIYANSEISRNHPSHHYSIAISRPRSGGARLLARNQSGKRSNRGGQCLYDSHRLPWQRHRREHGSRLGFIYTWSGTAWVEQHEFDELAQKQ